MSILSFISNIFQPAVDLVDTLHTSEEEKLTLEKELRKVENAFSGKILDYESKLLESRSAIIQSESTGRSWLQRNWRPITMLTFLILVVCDSFGLLTFRLTEEAWMLLQIGLGGYVVGRSAEKIIPGLFNKLKQGAVG